MTSINESTPVADITEPFTRRLGLQISALSEGYACLTMPAGETCLNMWGTPHGGAIFTLCDVASGLAAIALRHEAVVTVSASVDYLSAAAPKGELTAHGRVDHAGGHTVFCTTDVTDEGGTPVARYHGVYHCTGKAVSL
jgi:uncharacterized protein (TIGR00369 family)